MICLGSIPGLSYSRFDLFCAVAADLWIALLQVPSVSVVIALERGVVWVGWVVGEVLRQRFGEEMLVFQTCLAEGVVLLRRGTRLWCGVLNSSRLSVCGNRRIGDFAILCQSVSQ